MIDDDVDVDVVEVIEVHGRVIFCKDKMYNAVNVGSCQNVKVLTISGQGVELEEALSEYLPVKIPQRDAYSITLYTVNTDNEYLMSDPNNGSRC